MQAVSSKTENEIGTLTAGRFISPIFMNTRIDKRDRKRALKDISILCPVYRKLSCWIEAQLALSSSENDKKSLENVSTKGGISETMVTSLTKGTSFLSAVQWGIERCFEIRSEICKNLAVKAA